MLSIRLRPDGRFPTAEGQRTYYVHAVSAGFGVIFLAGVLSGLLGIGSGAVKVLAMDYFMLIPFKVSTTTSNFMIGVTAAASVGIYLNRGYIDPGLSMPVMLRVLMGSLSRAHILVKNRDPAITYYFQHSHTASCNRHDTQRVDWESLKWYAGTMAGPTYPNTKLFQLTHRIYAVCME
jgi:uncharacterized membrane protein YfcA